MATERDAETVTIKMCRVPNALGPDQMFFRPTLVFQTMLDVHVADAGLEFSLDIGTGRNRARFISEASVEEGSARWDDIMQRQLTVVAAEEARDDSEAVKKHLLAAGTWGDAERVRHLIRTCYVTTSIANQALVEVAGAGASEVVGVLLQARACADYAAPALDDKTALHAACEAGLEDTAALLIASMSTEGFARKTRSGGHTAMDVLRRSDMNGMARRLEAVFAHTQSCAIACAQRQRTNTKEREEPGTEVEAESVGDSA